MTDHARTRIRDAAARAVTGLPTTGPNVFKARTRPLGEKHSDTLLVYTTTDNRWPAGDAMGSSPILGRRCALVIEGRIQRVGQNAAELAEDALDRIETEINAPLVNAVAAGGALNNAALPIPTVVVAIEWQGTIKTLRAEGNVQLGGIRMEFAVLYRTPENDLTTFV